MYLTCTKITDHIERRNLLGGAAVTLTQAGRIPTDIVLDIAGGKMYWGEYDDFNGKIKWANLDGSGVQTIVTGLQWPMGLGLDFINRRLYWTDSLKHKIQYSNMDGSDVTDLMSNSSYEPWGIVIAPGLNAPPIADAGPNQVVYVCSDDELADVTLDGSGSYDDDNDILDYYWSWIVDGNLYEANGVSPTIQLPVGEYEIELIVDDGMELSGPNYCTITIIEPLRTKMLCIPRFLNTQSRRGNVMTFVYMPDGVEPNDIDSDEPLLLVCDSNAVEQKRQFVRQWNMHGRSRTWILAWFDKGDCIDILSPGYNRIKVEGRLNSGRCYYANSSIYVYQPRPFRRWWSIPRH
jgi:hypothetical protein